MIKGSAARRYARALFELLDSSSVGSVREGLASMSRAITESDALKHVVASPVFSIEDKMAVLSGLSDRVQCPDVVKRFLRLVVLKNRVRELPAIAEAFADLADQTKGATSVTVTSSAPLPRKEQERLQAQLRTLMHGDVAITYQTDPSLIAGLQVHVGSLVFDTSLRNRLDTMRTLLTKE